LAGSRILVAGSLRVSHVNRQILLAQIPQGKLGTEHFRPSEAAVPSPAEGEVLLRTRYVALDAANRAWMLGQTYRAGLSAGDVMAGAGLCEVVESRATGFKPGDIVYADPGWQDYVALPAAKVLALGQADPITHLLSVYGTAGLTAHFGLREIGQPKPGETVVVTAAAGAVGLFVGQIAKLLGCRVVGVAGGPEKCAMLTREYGFDAAVDYKAHGENGMALFAAIGAACPDGVDVYFDNVGGAILDTCLFAMRPFGRVVLCGAISAYDGTMPHGVRGLAGAVSKRLLLRGFIVSDFYRGDARERAIAELRGWVADGRLKVKEDIVEGLENLPGALVGLLGGANVGKRMVKVA
jgi:NADPH-dependent curcumin reductase CurA